ncbi:MAG: single-stranded DNA-binding protein [Propionibacteriaceae bacterium]|nr:single-stranded DNA-binding protein [Propionibacteriaceae bacterium]
MDALIWMTGNVGGEVEYRHVRDDLGFASFRLACTPRMRKAGDWVDAETTWIGVTCSRSLAEHVKSSLGKGDPVVVVGRLRTTRWTDQQGITQERMIIEASAVGHDLSRGTSVFRKAIRPVVEEVSVSDLVAATEAQADEEEAAAEGSAA